MTPDEVDKLRFKLYSKVLSTFGIVGLLAILTPAILSFILNIKQTRDWFLEIDSITKLKDANARLISAENVKMQEDRLKTELEIRRLELNAEIEKRNQDNQLIKTRLDMEIQTKQEHENAEKNAKEEIKSAINYAKKAILELESEYKILEGRKLQAERRIVDYEASNLPDDKIELKRDKLELLSIAEQKQNIQNKLKASRVDLAKLEENLVKHEK